MNLQKIRTVDREQFFLKSQTLCPKIFSFHTGLGCALGKGYLSLAVTPQIYNFIEEIINRSVALRIRKKKEKGTKRKPLESSG